VNIYNEQDKNIRKTWLLMFFFLVVVILVGWGISWYTETPAVLYVAVIVAILMNFFSYWYSDKIVIAMTRAKPVTNESHPDYWNVVENLSITAGLPMPKLYVVNDPAPNAFATGRNPKHAAVAATTGLLQILDRTELEGVMAHELSHIGNRDMLVSTIAVTLVGFVAIIADIFWRVSFFGGNRDNNGKGNAIFMVIAIVGVILAPLAAQLIHFAISRRREYLADASGALLTRFPEGLARALGKISSYKAPMRHTSHATAHLFISNPFGAEGFTGFVNKLFSTHPPVQERINALLGRSKDNG